MRNIIFLDIDGVLNCEKSYKGGYSSYVEFINKSGQEDFYSKFYPPSKYLINKLIEQTNADIVISSSWRSSGINWMRDIWKRENMKGEIIGVTDSIRCRDIKIPRGVEIDKWLEDQGYKTINWSEEIQLNYMKQSNIHNYIIIDDDSDMLYNQRKHFVHVLDDNTNKRGFSQRHFEKALKTLPKSVIQLNYE